MENTCEEMKSDDRCCNNSKSRENSNFSRNLHLSTGQSISLELSSTKWSIKNVDEMMSFQTILNNPRYFEETIEHAACVSTRSTNSRVSGLFSNENKNKVAAKIIRSQRNNVKHKSFVSPDFVTWENQANKLSVQNVKRTSSSQVSSLTVSDAEVKRTRSAGKIIKGVLPIHENFNRKAVQKSIVGDDDVQICDTNTFISTVVCKSETKREVLVVDDDDDVQICDVGAFISTPGVCRSQAKKKALVVDNDDHVQICDADAFISTSQTKGNPFVVEINEDCDDIQEIIVIATKKSGEGEDIICIDNKPSKISKLNEYDVYVKWCDQFKCLKQTDILGNKKAFVNTSSNEFPLRDGHQFFSLLSNDTFAQSVITFLSNLTCPEHSLSDEQITQLLKILLETTNSALGASICNLMYQHYSFHSWNFKKDWWPFLELAVEHYYQNETQLIAKLISFFVSVLEENWQKHGTNSELSFLIKRFFYPAEDFFRVQILLNWIGKMFKSSSSRICEELLSLLKLAVLTNKRPYILDRIAEKLYYIVKDHSQSLRRMVFDLVEPCSLKLCLLKLIVEKDNPYLLSGCKHSEISENLFCRQLVNLFTNVTPLKNFSYSAHEDDAENVKDSFDELIYIMTSIVQSFITAIVNEDVELPLKEFTGLVEVSCSINCFCERMSVLCPTISENLLSNLKFSIYNSLR